MWLYQINKMYVKIKKNSFKGNNIIDSIYNFEF